MKSSKRLEQQATNLIKQSELKQKRVKSKRHEEQIVLPKEVKELYRQFWRGLREL